MDLRADAFRRPFRLLPQPAEPSGGVTQVTPHQNVSLVSQEARIDQLPVLPYAGLSIMYGG